MNCWEFKKCEREMYENCSAYPDMGRSCWKKQGTMCDGGRLRMSTTAERIAFCRRCEFYAKHAEKF